MKRAQWSEYEKFIILLDKYNRPGCNRGFQAYLDYRIVINVLNDVVPVAKGHGEFIIEFFYMAEKKGNKIVEIPYIHPVDIEGNSKSFPNLPKFLQFGLFYFLRIIKILLKKT